MRRLRPVAITGMGCLCAAGLDLPTCADFLFQGKRNPAPPSRVAIASSPPYPVFEVPDPFSIKPFSITPAGSETANWR